MDIPGGTSGKECTSAGDARDLGSIPESGRSPKGEHGDLLHHYSLENSMDRGAWWATVNGAAESQTGLNN